MDNTLLRRAAFAAALCMAALPSLHAQDTPPAASAETTTAAAGLDGAAPNATETAAQRAWNAAAAAMQHGPQTVALSNQASLKLPEGFGFVPPRQGKALMEAMGNSIGGTFLGLIVPTADDEDSWIATVDYEPAGYIKDDDARHWKADELLADLKEGTEAGNERRQRMGFHALEVTRWIEPPNYDDSTQRLVWSVELREKGARDDDDHTVNYNTYVLGREGYVSLDFITSQSHIDAEKPVANTLLSAISFNEGKRYADFNASTDRVAEYGLAALIGGIAAKKLGLFATLGLLLAKFSKLIIVGLVAAGAAIKKFFFGGTARSGRE
ncbi:DUF2167 domain-containing protein [Dokdonella sp.]|uniref:DUF2167 domain-containing protein n=1 Tax=Dokdonella sp. TaxID=2291710 RepID=UPI0026378C69|nr:DUF2167 domain-containing protein [Dokdonella sp.]